MTAVSRFYRMLSSLQILVTRKFVTADVVFVDTARNQHLSQPTDQGGRPSDIVDRSSQLIQILGQHFLVDPTGLAVPSFFRAPHLRHCGNETKLWVCLFQILQDYHEGRVFGSPVRIKKVQLVWRPVMVGLPYDTGKRRNSDSTGKEHGRFSGILMQRE